MWSIPASTLVSITSCKCQYPVQVFSRHASEMSLCLMRADGSGYLEVSLDPITNKSGDVWHVQLSGLKVSCFTACCCWFVLKSQISNLSNWSLSSRSLRPKLTEPPVPWRITSWHVQLLGPQGQLLHSCFTAAWHCLFPCLAPLQRLDHLLCLSLIPAGRRQLGLRLARQRRRHLGRRRPLPPSIHHVGPLLPPSTTHPAASSSI